MGKNKVHRLCKTLNQPIDCKESSVQLLVDFIVFKLKKKDVKKSWDDLGYDIQEFHIPESTTQYMRSNFLKQKSAEVGETTEPKDKENVSQKANQEPVQPPKEEEPAKPELTSEEKEALRKKQEQEQIDKMITRAKTMKQMSFLNLESDVFAIY